jgi:two-component system, NtrC family, nitrogen regulation sensor histidine kinase NtrY
MKVLRFKWLLTVLIIVLVLLALAAESVYFSDFEYFYKTRRFNKILNSRERILEECLNGMKPILAEDDHHGSITENNLFSIAENNNITILEFLDNKLIYWSDNGYNVPSNLGDTTYSNNLVFLQNGWFLTRTIEAGNERIVGLLRLHYDYSFENDIIKSGFDKSFRLSEDVGFSNDKSASRFHISDNSGQFLFSLVFPEVRKNSLLILLPLLLWTAALFLFVLLLLEINRIFSEKGRYIYGVAFLLIAFSSIYAVILLAGRPTVFMQTELFSPYRFSLNNGIPSLGHLLVLSILALTFSNACYKYFPLKESAKYKSSRDTVLLSVLLLAGALFLYFFHYIFSRLISTSNISFETYKVLDLSVYSIIGFTSLFLLLIIPVLFFIRTFQFYRHLSNVRFLVSVIPSIIFLSAVYFNNSDIFIPLVLFYILLSGSIWYSGKKKIGIFNMAVFFSLIFGLYSLYFITMYSEVKTTENLKIQTVSFSTENDPEAEHLLLELWPMLSKDDALKKMMESDSFNKSREDLYSLSNYLQSTYFTGYWANFNFNIVLCRNDDPLNLGPGNDVFENCFKFFGERIKLNGHKLTGTDFYFIDNQGGRSYYLGKMFFRGEGGFTNGLFIELYSDINVFQPGYSSLLLDKKYHGYSGLKDYSFAKYINGEVVLRTGEFPYDKTDAEYVDKLSDYRVFRAEGFKHVLFKNGNATVIISRPYLTTGDMAISFAYLFAFILLLSYIFIFFLRRPAVKGMNFFNFRQKLQLSYIGILLFSFILIGIVVASLTINQYQSKHNENIKEKLNSVYMELDAKLSMEEHLTNEWRNNSYASLNELLIQLSNIFNTDINLYDLQGYLIATSRPEIFSRNLTSRRINNMASINLKDFTKSEYIQKEKIGNLEYLSMYVPFFNTENKVIAYLNLPYFRMQSVLAKEISNLVVAVINFTLLLIVITMSIAVFISGRLTAPLSMLGEGLASVEVGKKSEHLNYRGSDEIAELVKQYNRMVDEIEDSTHKLANSEREYAWREMAKQIAHEIKNPLTPMKLNVQQLFKSWNDKVPGFEKKLEKFTKNQIEYIDNLSSIASAFSSFAKMPGIKPTEINLTDQIITTLELFKNSANISFRVKWPQETKVIVFADKEQLNGVFSNLIKNGIQSIPQGREGVIKVTMEISGNKVVVSVSDNGSGIPDDIRKKLFTPNFTTKTSGMGLGLSIVKKYVEAANGRIWFESEADKGSTFYVELPLKYTVEKLST